MTTQRTLIRVDLQIDRDWAVGAAPDLWFRPDEVATSDEERAVRLPVQRDPAGQYHLPATSLVGGLRQHLGVDAVRWLGADVGGDTVPSQVRCLAATLHPRTVEDERLVARIVTTTAIDPARRAAHARALRREEVLPPALVTWWLEWDHRDDDLRLADLLKKLRTWRPVIGRRRAAGRGRGHVVAVWHRTVDLATVDGLTWWLGERPALRWTSREGLPNSEWTREEGTVADTGSPVLSWTFRVEDALHVGGAGVDGNLAFTRGVVPSTTWRGVFRHRVAHVARVTTEDPTEADRLVAETLARLFGSARDRGTSDASGHRGQLRFGDSPVQGARHRRTHVAIDRISGGTVAGYAEDPKDDQGGLLYEVEYFGPGATLELAIYDDSGRGITEADRALLQAVVRDLDDGIIGVGGLTSRGYGTLMLQSTGGSR